MSGFTSSDLEVTNASDRDAFLSRYDSNGTLLWIRQFGTPESDYSYGVSADGLGSVYVADTTSGSLESPNAGDRDVFLRKYDSDGTLQWNQQFGSELGETAMVCQPAALVTFTSREVPWATWLEPST